LLFGDELFQNIKDICVQKNDAGSEQRILLTDDESFRKDLGGQHHDTELHDRNQKTGVSSEMTTQILEVLECNFQCCCPQFLQTCIMVEILQKEHCLPSYCYLPFICCRVALPR